MTNSPSQQRRFHIAAGSIAAALAALALAVLACDRLDPVLYQELMRNVLLIKSHTVAGLALAGGSLLLHVAARECATLLQRMAKIGAYCLAGLLLGWGAQALLLTFPAAASVIDQLLPLVQIDPVQFRIGATMPPNAICLILAGASLLLLDHRSRNAHYIAEYCALGIVCIMGILLIGQIYAAAVYAPIAAFATGSMQAPVFFLLLASAILCARPAHRLMAVFLSDGPGGHLLRRLLPTTLALLLAFDFVVEWGANASFYSHDKILPLIVVFDCGLLFVLFWRAAVLLNEENDVRRQGEAALDKSNALLSVISNSTMDPIFVKDLAGRMIFANPAAVTVIGRGSYAILGLTSKELYADPEDVAAIDAHDRLVHTSGLAQAFEEVIHSPSGIRIFHVTKSPWKNELGQIAGIVGVATDITDRKRNEDALKAHEMQLEDLVAARTAEVRELVGHLESTREEEKRALARELHDDLGSSLTALNMHLAIIFQKIASDASFGERIGKVQTLLSSITATTRRIQSGLRPDKLDIFGIKAAISDLVLEFTNYTGIACRASLPDEDISYGSHVEISLFRMTQETLNNIAKHAKATSAEVILDDDEEQIMLTIRDDGIGMPKDRLTRNTHGLRGMRERAQYLGGRVDIASVEGQGTRITVTLPKTAISGADEARADLQKEPGAGKDD